MPDYLLFIIVLYLLILARRLQLLKEKSRKSVVSPSNSVSQSCLLTPCGSGWTSQSPGPLTSVCWAGLHHQAHIIYISVDGQF